MKTEYYPTEAAGPIVAGVKNPGTGEPVMLSDAQAEHALRLGHLSREKPVTQPIYKKRGYGRVR